MTPSNLGFRSAAVLLAALHLGCGVEQAPAPIGAEGHAIAGNAALRDEAVDAPWRMEPRPVRYPCGFSRYTPRFCTGWEYPPIPIQISIHDENLYSVYGRTYYQVRDFLSLRITERDGDTGATVTTDVPFSELHEVERTVPNWPVGSTYAPLRRVCNRTRGEDCSGMARVDDTSEWHATYFYRPRQVTPGKDVELEVNWTGSAVQGDGVWPMPKWGLRVHLGEAPLPKFGADWAYGDLHYHSQGTDNEGESAYSYRGVIQAMRGLGLDFVFATDHASDSAQATAVRNVRLDIGFGFPLLGGHLSLYAKDLWKQPLFDALRDMSLERFRWAFDVVAEANRDALWGPMAGRLSSTNFAPQLFLGGEVDVVPEIDGTELPPSLIRFGNGRTYNYLSACADLPEEMSSLEEYADIRVCPNGAGIDLLQQIPGESRWLIKDVQGIGELEVARQHLLHLPTPGQRDAFVSSRTSLYGGATRRLGAVMRDDYATAGKGLAFLAHPLAGSTGRGLGRLGPDLIPYSHAQLADAFASPHVVGLQLWNEDVRLRTETQRPRSGELGGSTLYTMAGIWGESPPIPEIYGSLHHGTRAWDDVNLWGLDARRTSTLPWLAQNQPRRWFMAGGSDAHGDLNFRREGALDGVSAVTDTAIGKPRNLVQAGSPAGPPLAATAGPSAQPFTQTQITGALQNGHFAVTDGPAVRIAIDRNASGVIDEGDTMMGDVLDQEVTIYANQSGLIPVLVEWKSTPEFGPVERVDLYVGAHSTALGASAVYAAPDHGVRRPEDPQSTAGSRSYLPNGVVGASGGVTVMGDGYWRDPRAGQLDSLSRSFASTGGSYGGTLRFLLSADSFRVGRLEEPRTIVSPAAPDRMFFRAFVRTRPKETDPAKCTGSALPLHQGKCIARIAFSNPVWLVQHVLIPHWPR